MTENEKDPLPEKNDQPQKDIPLWLQGLQEKPEGPSPDENLSDAPGKEWVKESNLMDDITPPAGLSNLPAPGDELLEDTEEIPTVSGIIGNVDEDLPDWLSELSGVDPAVPMTEKMSNDAMPTSEANQSFEDGKEDTDEIQLKATNLATEANFIEISEIDLDNLPDTPIEDDGEVLSEDEDLPAWLNEMITPDLPGLSDQGVELVEGEIPPSDETPEEAVIAMGRLDLEVEQDSQEQSMDRGDTDEHDPEQSIEINLPEPELSPLEDTSPVIVTLADEEDDSQILPIVDEPHEQGRGFLDGVTDGTTEVEQFDSSGVPQTLRFAKVYLDQGEIQQALDILHPYIEKASYLSEIKRWLMDAAQSNMNAGCELWEALGDIAICQDNPTEALDAYTKAIHYLLSQKDTHEPR